MWTATGTIAPNDALFAKTYPAPAAPGVVEQPPAPATVDAAFAVNSAVAVPSPAAPAVMTGAGVLSRLHHHGWVEEDGADALDVIPAILR